MWQLKNRVFRLLDQLKQIRKRIILDYRVHSKPKVVSIQGIKVSLTEDMSGRLVEALYSGAYEKYELELVKSQLHPSDIVMELGTGLGLVSIYCAKRIGSERVFTYEANPELEPIIRHNYAMNQVAPTLTICMLGDKLGEQKFYVRKNFWASSTIPRSPNDKAIKVHVKSFNQEVKRINPTFLIIDIEGGEYELLKDAELHNVQTIVMELHKSFIGYEKAEVVISRLTETGFRVNQELSYNEELLLQRN